MPTDDAIILEAFAELIEHDALSPGGHWRLLAPVGGCDLVHVPTVLRNIAATMRAARRPVGPVQ